MKSKNFPALFTGFDDPAAARRQARRLKNRRGAAGLGFEDPEAARQQVRARCAEQVKFLIRREIEDKPQIIRELVEAHHEEVLALVAAGRALDRNTVENALKKIAIIYASRGDVTHHEIAQGRELSLYLFEAFYGVGRHFPSPYRPSTRDAIERGEISQRYRCRINRQPLPSPAPFKRQRPMNMPPRTIDKVRAALRRDLRVGHVYLGAIAFCGVIWTIIGLLAIGGGR